MDGHTLIIPTYNRPELLRRLVRYYHDGGGDMNLLVLDSSRPAIVEENAKALSFYGTALRHIAFPETLPMAAKIAQGLADVQTRYISFCADDDLVFFRGMQDAVAFLDAHADYVCAHGLYINFFQAGHDVHLMVEYAGPGNEAAHPGARIFRLFQKYESLFYAVFRTSDLRDIFSIVATLPTLHYQELFQSVGALIKGKVRRFPEIYAARQSCDPAEPQRDKWQTYYWFADNPAEVLKHYRNYCEAVCKFYAAHATKPLLDEDAFQKGLDLAHAIYFSSGCPPEYFYSVLQCYWPEDPYVKFGAFEVLREAAKPSLFNGSNNPDDDPAVNLFNQLRTPTRFPRSRAARTLAAAWYFAWSVPGLAKINRDARVSCRMPWKCHLPPRLRWLAALPDFRGAYAELCRYLDKS